MRNQAFIDEWQGKIYEVIDAYSPDYIWFDFGLDFLPEGYVKDFLAYYYNHGEANGKEVLVTYKTHDLVPGSGLLDHELGQEPQLTYHEWITDSTVDDRGAWGYADDLTFKIPQPGDRQPGGPGEQEWLSAAQRGSQGGWLDSGREPAICCSRSAPGWM